MRVGETQDIAVRHPVCQRPYEANHLTTLGRNQCALGVRHELSKLFRTAIAAYPAVRAQK